MWHSTSSGRTGAAAPQASQPVGRSNIQEEFETRRNVRDEGYNRFNTTAIREAAQKELRQMETRVRIAMGNRNRRGNAGSR